VLEQKKQNGKLVALRAAFPHTIPILTSFLVLGMAYGVLMSSKGYGPLWSGFVSAFAFCGSMQYAAITLLTAAFDPLGAFLLSFMVNARHLFYGISLLKKYRGLGMLRPFLIYTMCDETFSVVATVDPPEEVDRGWFYFFISLLDWVYWVTGTVLGGVAGSLIMFNTAGMDFALTAMFVVLFLEQMLQPARRRAGIMGLACTVAALAVFGAERMVIPAMMLILVVLLLGGRKHETE